MAKTANLLTDGYGGPDRIGLLLPLHWQTVCLLLGGVAAGATVVVAASPEALAGCSLAFVAAADAEAAMDAGVDDVFACSLTPFATRLPSVPAMVLDAALEIPTYGDHFPGRPHEISLEVDGRAFMTSPENVGPTDRVLTALDPATHRGLQSILGPLQAGAAVVLLADGARDVAITAESVTAWVDESGLHRT